MTLTEKEKQVVLRYREEQARIQAVIQKRKTCEHKWSYRGEYRGESGYECFKCGETKWE